MLTDPAEVLSFCISLFGLLPQGVHLLQGHVGERAPRGGSLMISDSVPPKLLG